MPQSIYPTVLVHAKQALAEYDKRTGQPEQELAAALRWLLLCLEEKEETLAAARSVSASLIRSANELDDENSRYGPNGEHPHARQLRRAAASIDSLLP